MSIDISAIQNVSSEYIKKAVTESPSLDYSDQSFGNVLQSAMNMMNETSVLERDAKTEEINFALGYSDNTHNLAIAQQKANVALQYTVAVRDRFMEAYKEIMQMQM